MFSIPIYSQKFAFFNGLFTSPNTLYRYGRFTFFFCLLISFQEGFCQSYVSAAGLRLGSEWGLSYKHGMGSNITLEGILQSSFGDNSNRFTLLGARHYPVITRGLNFYFGAGPHIGWLDLPGNGPAPVHAGLSLIGGAEISIGRLNVSWDIKPALNPIGFRSYKLLDTNTAVSARYIFVKKSEKTKKKSEKAKPRGKNNTTKRRSGKI